jgi:iron complex outermembrane receptor protein
MQSNPVRGLAGVSLFVLAAAIATPSLAQDIDATSTSADEESEAIVVTGSRIARPEIQSLAPIAVVGEEDILRDGNQNISDVLNELPQVATGSTRTNSNFLTSGTGISTIDLRSLGANRTLTLINGRRAISGFAGDSSVDLNNIPTDLIERVEIVTGGNSAVYGSDAVAGVVNFILKDSFEGFSVRAQSSITDEGDNPRYFLSATAGTTFGADDRGNIILNFSWDKDEGLRSSDRAISAQDCAFLVCGPAAYSSYSNQGRFELLSANGVARDILPGGESVFTFDRANNNSLVYGFPVGSGYNRNADRLIATPLERYVVTGLANYRVTDNITAFVEATFARTESDASLEPLALDATDIYFRETDPFGIPITNPFIPADVAAAIAAANSDGDATNDVDSIGFRRRQNDVFNRSNRSRRETWRAVAGLRGDIASRYNWEVSYVYGRLNDFNASEDIDNNRYRNALDAIRVGPGNVVGTDIVCRSEAARAEGCIPINIFGADTVDPRAAAYVQAVVPKSEDITNEQHVVTGSISGPLFSMWAGDVTAAIGGEYRRESTVDDLDILTNTGGNSGNQIPDLAGSFDVWEVFGELNVPLLRDLPFARRLELTGQVRYSDYSTIGSVFSWNAGATWEPFSGLRFRGVYAVANRAPNIGELYTQPSETFASVTDPCDGVTATNDPGGLGAACRAIPQIAAAIAADGVFEYTLADIQGINGFVGGNQNLQEETAKTLTLGAVVTPDQVPGLELTVDYFDIKIDDAIATLGRQNSIQQCLETGLAVYCDNIIRDANTGLIETVNGQLINVAARRVRGIDAGLRFARRLQWLGDDRLSLSIRYTYLMDNKTQSDPAEEVEDDAGTFGRAFSRHSARGTLSYSVDNVTIGWATQFLSGGPFLRDFVNADPEVVALNNVDDYWLHDFNIQVAAADNLTFYLNVDNVFDTKPQYLPGTPFGTPTGLETSADFDVFGRRFTAGVRVRF